MPSSAHGLLLLVASLPLVLVAQSTGDQIPLASRILQICDVYIAITDPESYQTPEPAHEALAAIRRGAGAQFDANLSAAFEEMMRSKVESTKLAGQ